MADGPIGTGSVFQITIRQWGRTLHTDRRITRFEPDRQVCYRLETGYIKLTSCQTFETLSAAVTRFSVRTKGNYRGALRVLAPLLDRWQKSHLVEEAAGLKRSLEETDQSP